MTAPHPLDDGGAGHLRPGMRLPDIVLASTLGTPINPTKLASAVVYIYPWTGTPGHPNPPGWDDIPGAHGSTPQAEGFRAYHGDFASAGFTIIGISGQSPAEQSAFAARLVLPFALLSDQDFVFADALALPQFETGGVTYLKRLTLIVRDGAIVETHYPVTNPADHASALLVHLGRV